MGVDIYEYYRDRDGDEQVRWIGKINAKGDVFKENPKTTYDNPWYYEKIGEVKVDLKNKEICVYDSNKTLVGKSIVKIEDGELVNLVYNGNISNDWNQVIGYMNSSKRLMIAYGYSDMCVGYVESTQELSNTMFYYAASAYFLLLRGKHNPVRWRAHKIPKRAVDAMMIPWTIADKVRYDMPVSNKSREYMETVDINYKNRCTSCGLGISIPNKDHLCSGCFKMIKLNSKFNLRKCICCGKELPESCMIVYDKCYECSEYS